MVLVLLLYLVALQVPRLTHGRPAAARVIQRVGLAALVCAYARLIQRCLCGLILVVLLDLAVGIRLLRMIGRGLHASGFQCLHIVFIIIQGMRVLLLQLSGLELASCLVFGKWLAQVVVVLGLKLRLGSLRLEGGLLRDYSG